MKIFLLMKMGVIVKPVKIFIRHIGLEYRFKFSFFVTGPADISKIFLADIIRSPNKTNVINSISALKFYFYRLKIK